VLGVRADFHRFVGIADRKVLEPARHVKAVILSPRSVLGADV